MHFVFELEPSMFKNAALRNEDICMLRHLNIILILSLAFTLSKMRCMFDLVSKCGAEFAENLATRSQPTQVELKDNCTKSMMDAIARAIFGLTVDSFKDPNNEFYVLGQEATTFDYIKTMKVFLLKLAPKLMTIRRLRLISERAARLFTHVVSSTMKSRQDEEVSRSDVIQLLMHATDSGKVPNLIMEDMRAQVFIFLFGSFDTTPTAMSFSSYEIAINPHVQEKLRAEVDAVLKAYDGNVTWETFQGMHDLEAVVNKTLRKYPPNTVTDRVCNTAIEILPALEGGSPYLVKPGTIYCQPFFGLHHNPQYFKEPDIFDPERFIDQLTRKTKEPPGFLPFGTGTRFCIAQRFAVMEGKLAIFYITAKCQLKPCSKTRVPIVLSRTSFIVTAVHGFWVEIVPSR